MEESRTCIACEGELAVGTLATIKDNAVFWRETGGDKTFMGMRVTVSSGVGTPVTALRCASCGRVELVAPG